MKVCTDSCILGAWFARKRLPHNTILDIGAGTGLLMLMLAQKTNAFIDGVELDTSCFNQLVENINASVWKERLTVYHGDVRSFSLPTRYDLIITNPPFFENDLPSFNHNERLAKHSSELSLEQLIDVIDSSLSADGGFGILLPFDRWEFFWNLSNRRHFRLNEKLFVKHSPEHNFSRAILYFTRSWQGATTSFEMSIHKKGGRGYFDEFVDLLKDYYLHL
jgi:tRNA1Val (adenine37-N6)-methyltransferase